MTKVTPVILCGGSGTRLWPLSRSGFPKQFLVLPGGDSSRSLFQQAVERINAIANSQIQLGETLIVTNEEHRFIALEQLREVKGEFNCLKTSFLLEPAGRNTAPALTFAALQAKNVKGQENAAEHDPILVVSPADQTVKYPLVFTRALQDCVGLVEADQLKQTIAILGVTPTSPQTGYGYIKHQESMGMHNEYDVEKFKEKPDTLNAQAYLEEGNYFWNSGIFVLRASTWLAAIKEFRADIFGATETAWIARTADQTGSSESDITFIRPDKEIFKSILSESIDYAVIEKCPGSKFKVKMVELNAGWNDLGSWDAVWQAGMRDENGNLTTGDAFISNSTNSLIHSSGRLVGVVGVDNLIVIETADAVLVVDRKNSQDVKHIVGYLDSKNRMEKNLHRKVVRPWGWYDSVDEGERFKVKRIQVRSGASLSLQIHHYRAEHWIVVKGVAEITNGDQVITLTENQSTYIPQGQIHRLANPGKTLLEIIEVQSGTYLGEDDIIRFDDVYGRR